MPDTNGQPVDSQGFAIERRRPGRRDVSPALIPLLRKPAGDGTVPGEGFRHRDAVPALNVGQDALDAARGVAMGLALSAPLWGAMAVLGLMLRR